MGSAGIKISSGSYDARTAPDYAFVYNSDWPSLACAFDDLVTVGANATVVVPHDLKIYPLILGWIVSGGINKGRIFSLSGSFESSPQTDITMSWNRTNITLVNSTANSYQVCVKAYNLDITVASDYTNPKPAPAKLPYDPHFGIKLVKHNKLIDSPDLRDFILHSRAQSPAVLSVVTGNNTISYNNPVGYVPWTFAFYDDGNGNYRGLAPGSQQSGSIFKLGSGLSSTQGSVTTTANGAILTSVSSTVSLSLVVLRDPLVASNIVNVAY